MVRFRRLRLYRRYAGPCLFPVERSGSAADRDLRHLHCRLPGPAAGRTGVRAAGRSLWPAQDIGDDHDPDGGRHLFHRPHPLLCADRHRRAADAAGRAAGAGFFNRRRIWRRGDLHRGIFDRPEARPDGQLAGVRDAGRLYRRRRHRHRPADVAERDADARMGLAHSLPGRRAAGPAWPLYAAEAGGDAGIPGL